MSILVFTSSDFEVLLILTLDILTLVYAVLNDTVEVCGDVYCWDITFCVVICGCSVGDALVEKSNDDIGSVRGSSVVLSELTQSKIGSFDIHINNDFLEIYINNRFSWHLHQ